MKTSNIKIDTRVHTRLKRHANKHGRIMGHLAAEFIDDGLKLSLPTPSVTRSVKTESPRAGSKMERGGGETMNAHTPGPWKSDGYHVRQSGQSGTRMIADVCYTGPHHTPPDEYPVSCRIADEANARLIASSPELLEALREQESAEQWIADNDESDPFFEETYKHMLNAARDSRRAAIAKATGKESA
tara:strand:+ start:204 stop:764 length:561 start_codon:yes stop_codon:yes gene_type:complete